MCRRNAEEEQVVVRLPRQIADRLPLLKDILSSSNPGEQDSDDDNDCPADMDTGRRDFDRKQLEPQKVSKEIPLRLPGSVWALVSLVLVLEGRVNPWQWLGDIQADPSLTQQTLEVCTATAQVYLQQ